MMRRTLLALLATLFMAFGLWCDKRGPAYYGVVPPCDNYSAANNRYGMNLGGARQFIL